MQGYALEAFAGGYSMSSFNSFNLPAPIRRCAAVLLLLGLPGLGPLGCSKLDDPTLQPEYDAATAEGPPPKSLVPHDPLRNVFWGDLHIHTSLSYDAYTMGVRARPDDAYTFAKGGSIEHALGYPLQLKRPLDFAAVTDHSELLGVAASLDDDTEAESMKSVIASGQPWRITMRYFETVLLRFKDKSFSGEALKGDDSSSVLLAAWQETVVSAQRNNDPGRFTTFIAYEWSSMPDGKNLHRNVIYKTQQVPVAPFSSRDSDNPMELWKALEKQRQKGMSVMAIPHNANVSDGRMYARVDYNGDPITADYARRRVRNEPISEILQIKGASETHPVLSAEDEFADFEIFNEQLRLKGGGSEPKGSYARDALRTGLEIALKDGVNPYQFGFIGSSDGHNAASPVEEDSYFGNLPIIDGSAGLRLGPSLLIPQSKNRARKWGAMGLAAVWSEENTREALFEAMERKETYATSGPRIVVRFFAGWDYEESMLNDADFVSLAYQHGVAMGGELVQGDHNATPGFLVSALKDPEGANLDRIQIVKGWLDEQGRSHEKIYDVAASDGRQPDAQTHKVEPLGNTVDIGAATYSNSIGAAQLYTFWQDPDFDPKQPAFYYARVIEIPTPRWSTYDAKRLGIEAPDPATIQERAITSAIWLQPDPH